MPSGYPKAGGFAAKKVTLPTLSAALAYLQHYCDTSEERIQAEVDAYRKLNEAKKPGE